MKLKTILPIALMALSATALSGCGDSGDKLTIWTFSDEMTNIVNKYYDGKANVIEKNTVTQVTSDLATAQRSNKNIPDIVCLEAAVVAKYTDVTIDSKQAAFLSLDDISGTEEMYDYTKSVSKTVDGHIIGLSWQATPGGFFYKEEIAKSVNINSPEEMKAKISTWQGYLALAEELKAQNIKICSSIQDPIKVFLGDRSKGWVDNNTLQMEDVMFGPTSGDKANCFDVVRTLHQNKYTKETGDRDEGWVKNIPSNDTLGYFCSSWGLNFDLMPAAGTTAGHWKMCEAPVNYFKGGTWLAIPKGAGKVDKAKEFIKFITTDQEFLKKRCLETGDFMNSRSVMQQMSENYTCDFLGGQNHLKILYEVAKKINGNLISPYDATIDSIFETVAGDYAQTIVDEQLTQEQARENQKDSFVTGVASRYSNIIIPE